jgi:hypothetical protein
MHSADEGRQPMYIGGILGLAVTILIIIVLLRVLGIV